MCFCWCFFLGFYHSKSPWKPPFGKYIYIPGTLNNQFLMDVWLNNHFPCKDVESSNWNNHKELVVWSSRYIIFFPTTMVCMNLRHFLTTSFFKSEPFNLFDSPQNGGHGHSSQLQPWKRPQIWKTQTRSFDLKNLVMDYYAHTPDIYIPRLFFTCFFFPRITLITPCKEKTVSGINFSSDIFLFIAEHLWIQIVFT